MAVKNNIQNKKQFQEAISRNRRMGIKSPSFGMVKRLPVNDEYKEFLEVYVFDKIGMSPQQLLSTLETQYHSEQNFRDRRNRNIEFIRGRHFNEMIYDSEIQRNVTQFQYLKRRNMPMLTYNVISKLVRSLVGQFREINTGNVVKCESKNVRGAEIAHVLTNCLDRTKKASEARSKDALNCKEMLASGRPVFKVKWGSKNNMGKPDVTFRNVSSANFVVNPGVVDYELDNLHRTLEIHDTSLNDIIMSFANGNYERGIDIQDSYRSYYGTEASRTSTGNQSYDGSSFRNASFNNQGVGGSSYRYFETWCKVSDYEAKTYDPLDGIGVTSVHKWRNPRDVEKEIEEENLRRESYLEGGTLDDDFKIQYSAEFVSRWYVTYLTPWGMVLDVRESPYKSGLPPYVFQAPDLNGEIYGIVEEVLDAQLSLDRQIRQADAIVSNAAKGVWLVPDTAIPDEYLPSEYITKLTQTDGGVVYKVKDGYEDLMPKQIYSQSSNVSGNVQQLIQLYSNLVDEISGNYGAAQGRGDSGGKTATGYALESQNAGLNVRDIMENYLNVLKNRDELMLRFIIEGYTKQDYLRITGEELDPRELIGFEFSVDQSKGTNSPAHRLALEQELLQLVYSQIIPFEVFLDISNNPVMIQAKQKLDEFNKDLEKKQAAAIDAQQGGSMGSAPQLGIPESKEMVQGSPQAGMLKDRGIEQNGRKLSKV